MLLVQIKELENTTVDKLIAQQYQEDISNTNQIMPTPNNRHQDKALTEIQRIAESALLLIQSVRSGNLESVEDCLEDNVSLETSDMTGNTLLILAAQSGSKRMCKFLLRRGSVINAQNMAGNTALHYSVMYEFTDLTKYLISKGANDTVLNMSGLTCHEGLSKTKASYKDFD